MTYTIDAMLWMMAFFIIGCVCGSIVTWLVVSDSEWNKNGGNKDLPEWD